MIRIDKAIVKQVKDIKITKLETYNEIVQRLLAEHKKQS